LNPSGILHIAAFVTLCESYIGIEPHFDLWNYFFHVRLRPSSDMEAVVWGSVDIFVWSRSGVNPYFCFPMSNPPSGWWKVCIFLRNDADMPLTIFMSCCPVPQPNWGMVWLSNTSTVYNPCMMSSGSCYEASWQARTFISCHVQPLQR
jgi:hypothetical protein